MSRGSRSAAKLVQEVVVLLLVAVTLSVGVKAFLAQAFYIPSASMEPGLLVDDRIVVEKPSYWFRGSPQRGDVVVFDDPGGWLSKAESAEATSPLTQVLTALGLYPTGGHLVKRVIGVGGDTVTCCDRQGRLSVNGVPLDEDDFIDPQAECDGPMAGCDGWAATVPAGQLFVMGDNRDESADSSFHLCTTDQGGCDPAAAYVPVDRVVGKVAALVWPLDHVGLVGRPETFAAVPDPS